MPPPAKSTGVERVWNIKGIYLHTVLIRTQTNMPQQTQHPSHSLSSHVQKFLCFSCVVHHSSYFFCPSQNSQWQGTHTKPFFFHLRQCASPPSFLPGIPESILAIENVKNEEKAEEGTMSTAAGRVLSRCWHPTVFEGSGCTERMGSDLTLLIKTLHWNKPQSSFSTGWRHAS